MPPKGTCYFCGKKNVYITTYWRIDGKGNFVGYPCCLYCDKVIEEIVEMNNKERREQA